MSGFEGFVLCIQGLDSFEYLSDQCSEQHWDAPACPSTSGFMEQCFIFLDSGITQDSKFDTSSAS